MSVLAILIACGREEEIATGTDSAFLSLGNTTLLVRTLMTYQAADTIDGIVVVVGEDRINSTLHLIKRYGCSKVSGVMAGGSTRLSIVRQVLAKIPDHPAIVVLQEASRPFVSEKLLAETIKGAKRYGCAIAAHRIPDAVKSAPKGMKAAKTVGRNTVWAAQTPQVFKIDVLEKIVHSKAQSIKIIDDESEFVRKPSEVHLVEAGSKNMKIRTTDDLAVATALLNANLT